MSYTNKKKYLLLYLIILISSLNVQSQDKSNKCTDTKEFSSGTYIGCLDFESNANGFGIMRFSDGNIYEGNWKRNQFQGYGKMKFKNGDIYTGYWSENKIEGEGEMIYSNNSYYKGFWKNNMYHGFGERKIIFDSQVQILKGEFKNDIFFDGLAAVTFSEGDKSLRSFKNGEIISTEYISLKFRKITKGDHYANGKLKNGVSTFIENNIITESKFVDGIMVSSLSNIENFFKPEDIIGTESFISLDLETHDNDNTMYIYLNFKTEIEIQPVRFIFDTGAEMFSIGYRLFENLKKNGLEYVDLDITVPTIGVTGVSTNNKVIKIKEIALGSYKVKDVIAYVETLETANSSLLGIQFLRKFKEVKWSLNSNKLTFYKE